MSVGVRGEEDRNGVAGNENDVGNDCPGQEFGHKNGDSSFLGVGGGRTINSDSKFGGDGPDVCFDPMGFLETYDVLLVEKGAEKAAFGASLDRVPFPPILDVMRVDDRNVGWRVNV
jgi:hypothetical protein